MQAISHECELNYFASAFGGGGVLEGEGGIGVGCSSKCSPAPSSRMLHLGGASWAEAAGSKTCGVLGGGIPHTVESCIPGKPQPQLHEAGNEEPYHSPSLG